MRIIRFPAISEQQFLGCVSAFADSLSGELNSALASLRRLEGSAKGAAFAYEMALDTHRYGALIVLDRWAALVHAFGPHLAHPVIEQAPARIAAAEEILARVNRLMDAAERYDGTLVEACELAFRSVESAFAAERAAAANSARLGPMLPEDYRDARRIFLEDLAAR